MSIPALIIMTALALALLALIRRGIIFVDASLPWFVGLVVLGFLSASPAFVTWVAGVLGIVYPPIAIVFMAIFVLVGLVTVLLIAFSQLRWRQIQLVRHLATQELAGQERELRRL